MFRTTTPIILQTPATCELCGQWMPAHSSSCPRSGKHPSQWTLDNDATSVATFDTFMLHEIENDTHEFIYNNNFENQSQLWSQETDDVIPSPSLSTISVSLPF
ncbi:hypothetical protein BDF20DRAFT_914875 [Mycotypha africana]|uniref:uncharacterized protein n=1 Tax=Mycotypha africana TaxID=64632 RepID=UPI0023018E00|nr:uncharacterized protein BDF20DRAFT_914875 [Mycotypha africana]KAI8973432.1 hypothetical protein BDF20DRAFT_914875 [Mycotypha africana]